MTNIQFDQKEILGLVYDAVAAAERYIKDNKFTEAEALLRQTLKVDPGCHTALRTLSHLYMKRNKPNEAVVLYEKILETEPDDHEALNNVALCYAATGDIDKAIENLKKCLKLQPNIPASYWNLAIQHKAKGDFAECFRVYESGIARLSHDAELRYNYAISLAENFRFQEAITQYQRAIAFNPSFASAHFNLGLLYLLVGDYERGWKEYEYRFDHVSLFFKFRMRFSGKEWDGREGSGTVLVYNEQGAGDTIQFARFLPEIKKRGYRVVLEVLPELIDLMSSCPGVDQVIPQRYKHTPPYDYHISIGSLGRVLGVKLDDNLWNGPYLKPTGSASEAFEDYKNDFKIGVCWAGNPVHRNDRNRSTFLKNFARLGEVPGVKLFSLQKDSRPRFWAEEGVVDLTEGCDDMSVVDMGDMLINFNYTAAIMQNMDAIVTVDTAVAHVAGAMGLRCYLMLPKMPDWRWGVSGEKTPWYPTIEIIRQEESYADCIEEVIRRIK